MNNKPPMNKDSKKSAQTMQSQAVDSSLTGGGGGGGGKDQPRQMKTLKNSVNDQRKSFGGPNNRQSISSLDNENKDEAEVIEQQQQAFIELLD